MPTTLGYTQTHPSSPERFVRMTKTVTEIRRKKAKKLPLIPSFKLGDGTALSGTKGVK